MELTAHYLPSFTFAKAKATLLINDSTGRTVQGS
jgi:hypothetical protein